MKKLLFLLLMFAAGSAGANEAHKQLSALNEEDRRVILTAFMRKGGESCLVSQTFYQGSDPNGNASWNVGCTNGKAFAIQIANDSQGSTKILSCDVLKAVARVECFKTFSQQR